MKKLAAFIFLLSLIGLVWASVEYRKTAWKEYQLGYEKHVSQKLGVFIEVFNKLGWVGMPVETRTTEKLYLSQENFPPFRRPFCSAKISGFLKVPETATYSLELASDDGAILYLDGFKALNNSGYHSFQSKKRQMHLKKGWHHLLIRYENEAGAAKLKLAWGKAGEERHSVEGDEIYLPLDLTVKEESLQSLPPLPFYNTGILTKELLRWNQIRACLIFLAFLAAIIFIFGNRVRNYFSKPESWMAVGIFLLALLLRAFHFLEYRQLRIQGILDGGDYQYFLLLPLRFVTDSEWISLHCGNLPLLIPLLGMIYKYFHFFPGIDYFSWLMIFLSSAATLFPWLLLRVGSPSQWAGLFGSLYLALAPVLTDFQIPYVSSDLLGIFTFSMALFFALKSLRDGRWSSHLLAGFFLALLPLTRTVYIPWAPVMAVILVILSRNRRRALAGLLLFAFTLLAYAWACWPQIHQSYFQYFLRDGFGATVIHRSATQPTFWLENIFWLPTYFLSYLALIFSKLLPGSDWWNFVARIFFSSVTLYSIYIIARRQTRVFLFLFFAVFIYLYEISSYHLHERLTLPVFIMIGMILALGLSQISHRVWKNAVTVGTLIFLVSGLWKGGLQFQTLISRHFEENNFLAWVKKTAPPKGILLTEFNRDPWKIHKGTGLPVIYAVTYPQSLVIQQEIIPVRGLTFLSKQCQLLNSPPILDPTRYVLSKLEKIGYRYLLIDSEFVHSLTNYYFANHIVSWVDLSKTRLTKLVDYPADSKKGIWELRLGIESEPLQNRVVQSHDFDQFLMPFEKRG